MAEVRRVVLPYAPRRVFQPYHDRVERWACIVAHRRAGKTVACVNDTIRKAITLPREHGRFAYVAPYLSQAKEVAWDYLKRFAQPITADKNESELWVEVVNGSRIRIHGADNPDRLRGSYLDGVVCDEFADWRPSVWGEVIRPMLADRQGWATFIGTPKGRNEFFKTWDGAANGWPVGDGERFRDPEWFSLMLRASETRLLNQRELDDARRTMTPEQYEQEMECSFDAAILGAYFGKELAEAERAGRVCDLQYERSLPVHTAWDLGIGDSTAIWFFQVVRGEVRVIDHYENHGQGLAHYSAVLESRGYTYGDDWVPHDARVKELGTGRTRVETLQQLGRKPRVVPGHTVHDGINAARVSLNACWFDRTRCADGLEALRQYRAEFDEKTKAFKDNPRHDWSSHSADAFRYMCMAWREMAGETKPRDPVAELLKPKTLNDMLAEHDAQYDE